MTAITKKLAKRRRAIIKNDISEEQHAANIFVHNTKQLDNKKGESSAELFKNRVAAVAKRSAVKAKKPTKRAVSTVVHVATVREPVVERTIKKNVSVRKVGNRSGHHGLDAQSMSEAHRLVALRKVKRKK